MGMHTLDIVFRQITTFIKVCAAFVFGLQTLWLMDFTKIFRLKAKNKGCTNFYECCDLTKKVYLAYLLSLVIKSPKLIGDFIFLSVSQPAMPFLKTTDNFQNSSIFNSLVDFVNLTLVAPEMKSKRRARGKGRLKKHVSPVYILILHIHFHHHLKDT